MALKVNNQYIRLLQNGDVEVYSNIEARNSYKEATSSKKILEKYNELSANWDTKLRELVILHGYSEEALYDESLRDELILLPGIKEICDELEKIGDEEYLYNSDLHYEKGANHDFPIIAEFFPDVKNSIPNIVSRATLLWESKNLSDIYKEAKAKNRFGVTEDC